MDLRTGSPVVEGRELRARHDNLETRPENKLLPDLLLNLAVEHRDALLKALIISALFGLVLAFVIPKRYESTVRIMPPEGQNAGALLAAVSGKMPAGLGDLAGGLLGSKNQGPLYLNLLQSRTILDHQVSKFDLQKVYWARYRKNARKKLVSRTSVSEDRKSGVITISVEDGDPSRAQALATGYVSELDALLSQVSTSAARRERMFIEHRLETAKADLTMAESEFSRFASKNNTLDIKEQTKAMVSASADLQGEVISAESQLQGLTQIYSEDNVRVRALRARIAELKRQLGKLSGTADSATTSLRSGDMYPPLRQLPILGVAWADLFRNVKIQETIFELLTQQYELAKIQEAKEIPTVRVIDPADYPERKSWPPRLLIIVIAMILGTLATFAWFWWEQDWLARDDDDPWRARWSQAAVLFRRRSQSSR